MVRDRAADGEYEHKQSLTNYLFPRVEVFLQSG